MIDMIEMIKRIVVVKLTIGEEVVIALRNEIAVDLIPGIDIVIEIGIEIGIGITNHRIGIQEVDLEVLQEEGGREFI